MRRVALARIERQTVAHRGQRLSRARIKLGEQSLRADVARLLIGARGPFDRLGAGEFIIEEAAFVLVGMGDDRRVADKVAHPIQNHRKTRRALEIGGTNLMNLDRRRIDRGFRIDQRAPAPALLPGPVFAKNFDKSDFDHHARRLPGEGLPTNEIGTWRVLAGGFRIKGHEPAKSVEKIRLEHGRLQTRAYSLTRTSGSSEVDAGSR